MGLCTSLVGVPAACDDNNLGSLKRSLIGSFDDVESITVSSAGTPDTDGEVTGVTRASGTKFEEFKVKKDTSSFGQDLVVDLVADTHSWSQTVSLGFRRFDLRKRNAIMLLAKGRRDLIVVVEDTNGTYWMLGSDQGMRLTENAATSNEARSAGQAIPITLSAENEKHMWYRVEPAIATGLLVAAI